MSDEAMQRAKDAEEHRRSYDGIMTASTEIGVPFAMALAVFFTSLVMANGIWLSLFAGVATYVFAHLVVKTFFSH
jgi:hypothetical protein